MAKLAKVFGGNVRAERERQRLTQVQLADLAGVSEEWVRRIERGVGEPSIAAIETISAALGCGPAFLFTEPSGQENGTLMAAITDLEPPEAKWLLQLISHIRRRPSRS